jgi:hypothetical protein
MTGWITVNPDTMSKKDSVEKQMAKMRDASMTSKLMPNWMQNECKTSKLNSR